MDELLESKKFWIGCAVAIVGIIFLFMFGMPQYNVWKQSLSGKAILKEAEYSRQVAILEAKAKKEAAEFENEAEVIRAKGVAEANKIIGDSLQGNDAYLRYLFINTMGDLDTSIIYVPTEAGLPVLENGRSAMQAPVVPSKK